MLVFICILGYFVVEAKSNTWSERLFLQHTIFITACRSVYTYFCIPVAENDIVIYYTDVFMFIVAVSSLVLLLHVAINHSKNK